MIRIASLTRVDMNLSKLWETEEDKRAAVPGVAKNQTQLSD